MYYNNLCLQLEEPSTELPRSYYDPTAICPIELLTTEPTPLREICLHHLHSNMAYTIKVNKRSTFWDFTPQKTVIPKFKQLPLAIRAELLVLHDHCDLHGHRRYERSNTFSRGLIYIGGNSPLSLMIREWGKPGEKMLLRYYRVYDFVYEITRLVPFIMPSGQGLYGTKLIDNIKESILFSKRVG